ncbi:MAG: class I tRNA ligase family protein, partial [Candidatus Binatia bacterium]
GPDGTIFVEMSEDEAAAAAAKHYGKPVPLRRDEDVLDTWFSSGLWPFSTLGWPEQTPELARYYPGDVLVTGFDIIFFWVARMMMMGMHFMEDVPFRTVYIHALVRDQFGQKMSKSKGNVIDPLDFIEKYGADALRFTLTALAAQGREIKLAEARVEGYRNFATKLWNAARFCQMNGCAPDASFDPKSCRETVNRWIVGRVVRTGETVTQALEAFKFNEAAGALYQFAWGEFCDWFLEFTKPILMGEDEAAKRETRATTAWTLGQLLHLLHPIMPFLTEELWEHLGGRAADGSESLLIAAAWPAAAPEMVDATAAAEIGWVIRVISGIRAVRAEMNVPPSTQLDMLMRDAGETTRQRLATHRDLITRLARLRQIETSAGEIPRGAVQIIVDEATILLPLAGVIDVEKERARLANAIDKAVAEIGKMEKKLANGQFVAKAPPEVIEDLRERLAEAKETGSRLVAARGRLTKL